MARINHNVSAMFTGNALRVNERAVAKSLERLSTGLRINRAGDDAAGLSVSEALRTQVSGLQMGNRNVQDGIALMNIAEGCLIEVQAMIQRMRELCIEAANDTLTSIERTYIQAETSQLTSEMDRIVSGTQYNSMTLLNGTAPWGTAPGGILHIGANNVATADTIQYQIPSMNTTGLGLTAMSVSTQSDATAAITTLDGALHSVNTLRANLGAIINRLEHALTNQENSITNMQAAESVLRDADFAYETTTFTKNQILQQSSTAMLAQANTAPQSVLNLLKG
jgi:flagellin